jgi:hypothetical protein
MGGELSFKIPDNGSSDNNVIGVWITIGVYAPHCRKSAPDEYHQLLAHYSVSIY